MAGTARRDDPLAAVTQQLLHDQHAALVDHITAEVFARQRSYAQMRDTSGYLAAVSHLVKLYCCTIAEDRRVHAEEVVALNVIGAHRAREGIKEGEMVESLNTAVVAGFAFLVRVLADICPSTEAMGPAVTTAFERTRLFSEDIEAGLRAGYNTEHEQRLPEHLRTQATAVDLLLEGVGSLGGGPWCRCT